MSTQTSPSVIWHDVECGAYEGDLELWRELAAETGGPILDLGCGTGRVAIDLARHGHSVHGLDLDPELVAALNARAAAGELPAAARVGDGREFDLSEDFPLVLAPMQFIQVLGGAAERLACLRCARRHLRPDGRDGRRDRRRHAARADRGGRPSPPRHARDRRLDLLEPAARRGPRHGHDRRPPSPTDGLPRPGSSKTSSTRFHCACSRQRRSRPRPARPVSSRSAAARSRPPTRMSARSSFSWRPADGAARPRPLPRPDEHLRRPRQHRLPAASAASGVGSASPTRAPARETRSTPAAHDLFYVGGGQDRDQRAVAADMVASKREALSAAADDGAVLLAVCGGYQLLGHSYQLGEERLPGLGIADLETVREPGPRLIGNVTIEAELGGAPRTIAGFENHGGRTHLGPGATPLGRVLSGFGNNGSDGLEGVRRDNLIGTYLHGPLLPKNAWLADHLIALALERRYGSRARPRAARRHARARRPRVGPRRRLTAGAAQLSACGPVSGSGEHAVQKSPSASTRRGPGRRGAERDARRTRRPDLRGRAADDRQRNRRNPLRRHDPPSAQRHDRVRRRRRRHPLRAARQRPALRRRGRGPPVRRDRRRPPARRARRRSPLRRLRRRLPRRRGR